MYGDSAKKKKFLVCKFSHFQYRETYLEVLFGDCLYWNKNRISLNLIFHTILNNKPGYQQSRVPYINYIIVATIKTE